MAVGYDDDDKQSRQWCGVFVWFEQFLLKSLCGQVLGREEEFIKTLFLGQFLTEFFLAGKGGTPPSPLVDDGRPKS